MDFIIADTFTASLAKLSGDDQKAAKMTAFDLQVDPANPGMKLHKLDRAKDKNFWSVRASKGLRLIVHRTAASFLLCYAGQHDDAYDWAERRKLETHPTTGAAQFVEVLERVEEVVIPKYIEVEQPKPPLFGDVTDAQLLSYGVPAELLPAVRKATEDTVLDLADHLPAEAAEALLELATGNTPEVPEPVTQGTDPFEHPDALRRFRTIGDVEELRRALDYPWDKWTVFLHPAQRETVEREYNGPARVSGSAGTGKTVVALHRAVHLARNHPDCRILLTTFTDTLANALKRMLPRLIGKQPRLAEQIEIHALGAVGTRLYQANFGRPDLVSAEQLAEFLGEAVGTPEDWRFTPKFLMAEWEEVVDAWQLRTWEDYRDVARLGRKTRLPEAQREKLWEVFEKVLQRLDDEGLVTRSGVFERLTRHYAPPKAGPYDFIVVDEAQDIGVPELRFLAALAGDKPDGLFFAGDLGQRIFQPPFSWKQLGVDIRGRSRTLRINYRTSHQIRAQADKLLGPEASDVDGNVQSRRGTVSVFNGPPAEIVLYDTVEDEQAAIGDWLKQRLTDGLEPEEIGIFVRSQAELERAKEAAAVAGLQVITLDDRMETTEGHASLGTMHLAKGLEFRAVVVMACDDEILPLQERIEAVTDDSDLEEVYNTERHLLYVACTRARDHLFVSGVRPGSEFLEDLLA